MNKAEMLSAMTERTGLSRAAIKDLMKHGWTYAEGTKYATFEKKLLGVERGGRNA